MKCCCWDHFTDRSFQLAKPQSSSLPSDRQKACFESLFAFLRRLS